MYEEVKRTVARLILDRHRGLSAKRFDEAWVKTGAQYA